MRLKKTESKNSCSLYVIKSFRDDNGKNTSKIVETLGTVKELREKLNGRDPEEWAKEHIEELNRQEKERKRKIIVEYSQSKRIPKEQQKLKK